MLRAQTSTECCSTMSLCRGTHLNHLYSAWGHSEALVQNWDLKLCPFWSLIFKGILELMGKLYCHDRTVSIIDLKIPETFFLDSRPLIITRRKTSMPGKNPLILKRGFGLSLFPSLESLKLIRWLIIKLKMESPPNSHQSIDKNEVWSHDYWHYVVDRASQGESGDMKLWHSFFELREYHWF